METVGHWEAGRVTPETRFIPAVHAFLGFCPHDPAWTFGERLRAAREAHGLSRRRVAALVGVDEATVARAERDVHGMARRSLAVVATLLTRGGIYVEAAARLHRPGRPVPVEEAQPRLGPRPSLPALTRR